MDQNGLFLKIIRPYMFLIGILLALFYVFHPDVIIVNAQNTSFGFSTRVPIDGDSVLDGYIIATTDEGYVVTTEAYQKNIIGVVTENPAIELNTGEAEGTYPLATSGEASVWVSLANGPIKKGDYITSSPWEGVGMKATGAGPVLGTAAEDVDVQEAADNEQVISKIRVVVRPTNDNNPSAAGTQSGGSSNTANFFTTASLIRFATGAVLILITIFMSLSYFGRLSLSGVEALGRNPLAFKKIQFGITLNVIIGFIVALVGIIAALYIMK
ncbi:hypothetical protein IPM65_03560 [Candidatus Roizmanbacteria bacterium]|nr:MAG: hypothetical protein IPM65_03560 [Candidatus Roizmanbacteria bacterium]